MTSSERDWSDTAAALRRAFDESFAREAAGASEEHLDFLKIRCGGDPYAVRLSEVAALHADRKIVPLPSSHSGLLGLCGFRGVAVPIFDLHALLGYRPASAPRWILLSGPASRPVGLAFETFESHLRVAKGDASSTPVESRPKPFLGGNVLTTGETLPLLCLSSILERIPEEGD